MYNFFKLRGEDISNMKLIAPKIGYQYALLYGNINSLVLVLGEPKT